MKLPEYSLKEPVKVATQQQGAYQDIIEYSPGTLVFPFWNETFLPDHRRAELKDAKRSSSEPLVMCIIGTEWVPVPERKIRKNG